MNTCLKRTYWIFILLLFVVFLVYLPGGVALAQEPTPTTVPPAEIPEPITVILFGTGLAALSAISGLRRRHKE